MLENNIMSHQESIELKDKAVLVYDLISRTLYSSIVPNPKEKNG